MLRVSTTTPPGWYPDPGHTGFGPAPERWWDGATWTEHRRAASAGPVPPGYPPQGGSAQQHGAPGGFPPPYPRGKPKGPLAAGIVAAVAVVLAIVVGAVLVGGDEGGRAAGPAPSASTGPPATEESTGPDDDGSTPAPGEERLPLASGVKLPLPSGWTRVDGTYGAAVNTTSYSCPLKRERCVRAGAAVYVTPEDGDPETVAKADIEANADSSYGADYYGGITSHEEVASEAVEVAGQEGYLVRWKIDNKEDPDAYVESVAFPHPDGSGQMLVLRAGLDIHDEAPSTDVLDELLEGVEQGSVVDDDSNESI
ncbi:DUF2510 domain-containing protein [Streptomyces sp. RKND-216]|nr:DUF2510 domain-containing protein [Streptomyces sp. RKND-216]